MTRRIRITEEQLKKISNVLTEDKESKNLSKARKYIRSVNSTLDAQKIVDAIRSDIPNSRIADCKFILGIARMALNNELHNHEIISQLNQTLKLVGSAAHVNEYDNNLNNETAETLIGRFAKIVQNDLEQSKQDLGSIQYIRNNDYQIVPINSFDEAKEYGQYTSWCVAHYDEMYENYTHKGLGKFYFCLKKGFEHIEKIKGENCPLDEYGLSMIAVSVNEDGSCNTITCRWNHDNNGNDSVMTPKELSEIIGINFYQIFKPWTEEELIAKGIITPKYAQKLLDDGNTCYEIFDFVDRGGDNGFAKVKLNDKYNFVNNERKIISKRWFDFVQSFHNGFAKVTNRFIGTHGYEEEEYNFINEKGEILSDIWLYSTTLGFVNGFVDVMFKNGDLYKLNTKGQLCDRYGEPIKLQTESTMTKSQVLLETTWNYHKGHSHDGSPYYSDNKYRMDGRDTGSFGSGTYFSTYKEESPKTDEMYGDSHKNQTPEFIEIDKKIYRVDIDLYKNLYRVYSEKQGNVLYTLLHNVNKLFSRINQFGKFDAKQAYYSNADLYQKIIRNAEALKLKCPSYLELTRMAQELGKDDSKRQSLSTVFMEYNGYNGVNVSGVPNFDNTLHGSVIYDLSKVEGKIKQETPNSLLFVNGSYKTSVVPRGFLPSDDDELSALNRESLQWIRKINDMPLQKGMRLLKNYVSSGGGILDKYEMKQLSDELQKRYLKLIYKEYFNRTGSIHKFTDLLPWIEKNQAYYWVNYTDEYDKISGLVSLLSYYENYELDWGLSEEETVTELKKYFNKLMMYHNGDLTEFEKYMLQKADYSEILGLV